MTLFGPGVVLVTKAKVSSGIIVVSVIMPQLYVLKSAICCHYCPNILDKAQDKTQMDRLDRQILRELEINARISNLDLAKKIGLSASACLRRVQSLEHNGVILGYRAVLDRSAMGGGFTAIVGVGLARHLKADQEAFESAMCAADEVRECHNVSGVIEYMLRVEVADLEAYKRFHTEVLGTVPEVRSIVTYIVMGSPKDR